MTWSYLVVDGDGDGDAPTGRLGVVSGTTVAVAVAVNDQVNAWQPA